jgi:hypothetical protein
MPLLAIYKIAETNDFQKEAVRDLNLRPPVV